MNDAGKKFEVIFVSSDNSKDEFEAYLSEMPWYAIPYDDKRKDKLDKIFEVSGNDWLCVLFSVLLYSFFHLTCLHICAM